MILLLGCGGPDGAPTAVGAAPAAAPDLVLVGVAGLRSDTVSRASEWFLSPYTGARGVVYAGAYAQTPSTFVSLGSLLTGRYPSAIPLCGFPSEPGDTTVPPPWCTVVPDIPTLPTVLGLYGYRTALVTADIQGSESLGALFQERFVVSERWEDTSTEWSLVTEAARRWWTADATRPRLLVVATADMNVRWVPALRTAMGLALDGDGGEPARIDRPKVIAGYQQAAVASGAATKALLDALPGERPRWAAVFGIHGINLGDTFVPTQALRDRSWSDIVLDRTLHVPLALIGPASDARVDDAIVELVDLLPTFLTLAGAVVPAGIPGRDLLAGEPEPAATAYGEFGDMLSVRQGDRVWSVRAFFHNRSSLDPELTNYILNYRADAHNWALHDLVQDPFQERNRIAEDPVEAVRMNDLLVRLRTGPGAPPIGTLDARRVWELRMAPADGYW